MTMPPEEREPSLEAFPPAGSVMAILFSALPRGVRIASRGMRASGG